MAENPQRALIAAVRRKDYDGPAPGAVIARCPACGEEMLLSRASQKRIKRGYTAYCSPCMVAAIARNGLPQFEFPTPEEVCENLGMTEKN